MAWRELNAAAGHRRRGAGLVYGAGRSCRMSPPWSRTPESASTTSSSEASPRWNGKGWHALVTMRIDGDVELPANATAKLGQTSLLGSLHVELAPPKNALRKGS